VPAAESTAPPSRADLWRVVALVLFAVALAARLVALSRLSGSPFFLPDSGDMRFYLDWAERIRAGVPQEGAFYGLPGYAYLLAGFLAIGAGSPFLILLAQCMLDAGIALLIFLTAGRLTADRRIGLAIGGIGAALWIFCIPAQAFAITLMPTTWGTFLLWALALGMLHTPARRTTRWFLVGFAAGLSALVLSNLLMLIPFGLGKLLFSRDAEGERRGWSGVRPRLVAACFLLLGAATGTAPVWGFHRFVVREPVFLSAHSGLNFFIGNNPAANGYPKTPPGMRASQRGMLRDSIALAEQEAGRPLTRSEVSAHWNAKASRFLREHPGGWGRLQLTKLFRFWNQFRYDDVGVIVLLREAGILIPGPGWGAIAWIGLPALLLGLLLHPPARPVIAVVLLHLASLLPVFVTERYRLPAAPGLCLLGAWMGVTTLLHLAQRRWRFPALATGATLLATPVVLRPCKEPELLALEPYNAGIHALRRGDLALAAPKLEAASEMVPENAEIQFAMGNLLLARGDSIGARQRYRRAIEINPRHEGAWNNLGYIALNEGRAELAIRFLETSSALDPEDDTTRELLERARQSLAPSPHPPSNP